MEGGTLQRARTQALTRSRYHANRFRFFRFIQRTPVQLIRSGSLQEVLTTMRSTKMSFVFLLGFQLLLGLISTAADSAAQQRAPTVKRLRIIDAHTHTDFYGGPERTTGIPVTREQYFKEWRRAGIVGAVAHAPSGGGTAPDLRDHNVITCFAASAQPDRALMEDGLKTGRYGCVKIYLGYVHQYAYDKNYDPVYELAEKYDVPVVFHTGDTYSSAAKLKFADPLTIDEVAVDHPRVKFVIAHCGNPWIESAAEVAYKNANVYLDGSAFLIGNLDRMPRRKVEAYLVTPISWIFGYVEDPAKLMFGSDWPLNDISAYVRAFKRAIPKENWSAVFYDNAARVFKLKIAPKIVTSRSR